MPSEGPGAGIKLANHLGSAISSGNPLAINTNSLSQRAAWPVNGCEAEAGSDERRTTSPFALMGQQGDTGPHLRAFC